MLAAIFIGFLFGFIGSMPVAGPIAVLVFSRGVENRVRSGLSIAVGGALAEGVYACLAFWGFSTLLAQYPILVPVTRGVAAVVLTVLGIVFLRHTPVNKDAPPKNEGWGGGFVLGFMITTLNPTLIITWSAAATTLLSTGFVTFEAPLAIPFGLAAMSGIISWFVLLLYLVRRFSDRFSERTLARIIQVMGLFLLGVAAWFLVSLGSYLLG